MMNISVSNKHNTTWKMVCTVFPGTLYRFCIRNLTLSISGSMSTTRTKIPYARTFYKVFYMYNLCSRRMEIV